MRHNKVLLLGAIFALVSITAILSFAGIKANNDASYMHYLQTTVDKTNSDTLDNTANQNDQPVAIVRFANNRCLSSAIRNFGNNNRTLSSRTCNIIDKVIEIMILQLSAIPAKKTYFSRENTLSYQEIFCRIVPPRAGPLA